MSNQPGSGIGKLGQRATMLPVENLGRVIFSAASWRRVAVAIFTAMLFATEASAAPWVVEWADTPDPVSEAQLDELEQRARDGDWNLKTEFAAVFLHGDCDRLKHGHRCRAMATRKAAAAVFLREVLDTEPNDSQRTRVGAFQETYAYQRYRDAVPNFDPASEACQEAVRYAQKAIGNGKRCMANVLGGMHSLGRCLEKDLGLATMYYKQATACPRP